MLNYNSERLLWIFSPPPVMPETAALTKQVGSLEQRILLCVLSAFVSIINPNLSDNYPFLLLEGNRLSLLSRPCQNTIFFSFSFSKQCLSCEKQHFLYAHVHPSLQLLPKVEGEI